jgi:hypothetical protein
MPPLNQGVDGKALDLDNSSVGSRDVGDKKASARAITHQGSQCGGEGLKSQGNQNL